MNIQKQIISFIKKGHFNTISSSTMIADALGKGADVVLSGFESLTPGSFAVGSVYYVFGIDQSNYHVHQQIEQAPQDCIVYVDMIGKQTIERAILGELVTNFLFHVKKVAGVIVNGPIRDYAALLNSGFPIWFKGKSPLGCFNKRTGIIEEAQTNIESKKAIIHGSIMVCDDTGCTIIKKDRIHSQTLSKIEALNLQELIWEDCLTMGNYSTYDIVCRKIYLKDEKLKNYFWKKYGQHFMNLAQVDFLKPVEIGHEPLRISSSPQNP